jgi:pimeloyl-ACP methyl ester carboxylesterase
MIQANPQIGNNSPFGEQPVSGDVPLHKISLKQRAIRMLLTLGIAYGLFVLMAAVFQRRLIYFPRTIPPALAEPSAAGLGFVPWRNPAGQIIGWKLPAASAPVASVLITHGNAGCAIDRGYLAGPIHDAAPVDVYVLEYPGYGSREGSPDKRSLLATADEAFGLLTNSLPKYLVSESIGAGVACHLAKAHSTNVAGLVLFMPYHDLASVAQRKMPFLPAYLLLLDRFNPAECLRDYRGPVKIVLAGADEIIPVESGRRLFEGYQGPKTLQIIPGARHNEVAEQSPEWWKEVFSFWRQNRPAKPGPSQ